MRKLIFFSSLVLCAACGNSGSSGTDAASGQSIVDSTKQPTGMDNSNVISTDTAAINMSNSVDKLDSAR